MTKNMKAEYKKKFIKKGRLFECCICKKIFSNQEMINHKKSYKRAHKSNKTEKYFDFIHEHIIKKFEKLNIVDEKVDQMLKKFAREVEHLSNEEINVFGQPVKIVDDKIDESCFTAQGKCVFCERKINKNGKCPCLRSVYNFGIVQRFESKFYSTQEIQFNCEYLQKQISEELEEFMKFFALRHFSYANCARMTLDLKDEELKFRETIELRWKNPEKASWQEYEKNVYLPPIKIQYLKNEAKVWGVEANILVTKFIRKFTFLGEYAADIISKMKAHLIKKQDSIFSIGNFYIGPIITVNWATLMNHSTHPNVGSIVGTFGGRPGVFFYALRDIKIGESLVYDYGKNWRFGPETKFIEFNREYIGEINDEICSVAEITNKPIEPRPKVLSDRSGPKKRMNHSFHKLIECNTERKGMKFEMHEFHKKFIN